MFSIEEPWKQRTSLLWWGESGQIRGRNWKGLGFHTGSVKRKGNLCWGYGNILLQWATWGQSRSFQIPWIYLLSVQCLSIDHSFSLFRSTGFPNTLVSSMLWASHWWWKECSVLVTMSALITPISSSVIKIYIKYIDLSYGNFILGPFQKYHAHTCKN
jgi:hypothetical protein